MRCVLLLSPFCWWGNWSTWRLSNCAQVTYLVNGIYLIPGGVDPLPLSITLCLCSLLYSFSIPYSSPLAPEATLFWSECLTWFLFYICCLLCSHKHYASWLRISSAKNRSLQLFKKSLSLNLSILLNVKLVYFKCSVFGALSICETPDGQDEQCKSSTWNILQYFGNRTTFLIVFRQRLNLR